MIELAPTPNFDTPAVYNWILHDPANAVFNGPVPAEPGMVQADRRDFTPATTDTTGRPLVIFAAQKEHYNIFRHRKFLASFDADILIEQAIRITAISCLLVKPDTPNQQQLIAAFRQYDAQRDGDVVAYAAAHMPNGNTANMFSVKATYRVEKVGPRTVHTEQRDATLAMLRGRWNGTVQSSAGPEKLEQYIARKDLSVVLVPPTIDVGRPSSPVRNSHEIDAVDPTNPNPAVFDGFVARESVGLPCEIRGAERRSVLTLIRWPEFKVTWRDVVIDIGCGVHIVITIPFLQIRVGSLVLWAYLGHDNQVAGLLFRQVMNALVDAAIDAVVVGLVTEDYYAAAAAFAAEFEDKLIQYAGQDVLCLVPGIAVVREATGWNPPSPRTQVDGR